MFHDFDASQRKIHMVHESLQKSWKITIFNG
jgi:hypothetical protein